MARRLGSARGWETVALGPEPGGPRPAGRGWCCCGSDLDGRQLPFSAASEDMGAGFRRERSPEEASVWAEPQMTGGRRVAFHGGGRAGAKAGGLGSWPGTRAELGRWPAVSAFRACCGGQESARPADWAWDRASVSGRLREQWPEPTKCCGREASRLFTHDAVGAAAAWASPSAVHFPGEGAGAQCHLRCWPPGSGEGPQGLLMASYDPRVAQTPPSSGALPSQSPHPPTPHQGQ